MEPIQAKAQVTGKAAFQPALFLAMVFAGIATTMLGPLLPRLEARWGIGDAAAGLLFTALFLGTVSTGAVVGLLALRFGHLSLVRCGLVIASIGTALLGLAPWPQALAAAALIGCGLGLAIPAANLAVTGPRAVMLINFAWSIGAVGGPLLLAALSDAFLWGLAGALVCASLGRFAVPTRAAEDGGNGGKPVMSRKTVLTAVFIFFYVGVESSLDGWLSSYASRASDTHRLWAALPSVFWTGILLGRFLATLGLQRLRPAGLLFACLAAAFGGACLLLVTIQPWAVLAATAITGLGLAPIFPLAVSGYNETTQGEKSAGLIFSAGGLGGAAVPALVGSMSEVFGGLRLAMSIAPVLIVAMFLLWKASPVAARGG